MDDPRLSKLREAVLALCDGRFDVEIPAAPADALGELGQALRQLAGVIERRFAQFRQLTQVTEQVNAGLLVDEVLNHVYDSFRQLVPYDRIGFSLIDKEQQTVTAHWARSEASEIRLGQGYAAPLAGSSLQQIIATGQPRVLNDLEAYLREHPRSESTALVVQEGMRASLTCPLLAMGQPIGFMFFSSRQAQVYRPEHVALIREIAGHLALIVEKSRLYERLIQLNQEKNMLLGMAAHDLRSPITVIQGYLELLQGDLGPSDAVDEQEIYRLLQRTTKNMLGIINSFLDLSAIESGHLELRRKEVPLRSFLQEVHLASALLARGKGITLELELPAELPRLSLDADRLRQALDNLISNAIKFSFPGSIITLRAALTGEQLELAVQDRGQGIPAAELPYIFFAFSKTSVQPTAGERGSGLGLAIVRRLVQAHQGTVTVQSVEGQGTTFTIRLPHRLQPAEAPPAAGQISEAEL